MPIPVNQTQLYANLMYEVKIRIESIEHALNGRTALAHPFVREFCWLQLRMLCELIALACLVAHGDITFLQSHKLGKKTSAEQIMERLEGIRSHFYPKGCIQKESSHRNVKFHMDLIEPSPLTKEELVALYGKTHRHVHRGSLKNILKMDVHSPLDLKVDAPEIIKWAQKINDLLSNHFIYVGNGTALICNLRDSHGKVQVSTAESTEPVES